MARVSSGISDHEMTNHEWKMFNYEKKKEKLLNDNRFYCKCGHTVNIMPTREKKICSYCGYLVFRDKEMQKKYDIDIQNRENKMKFKKELRKMLNDRT